MPKAKSNHKLESQTHARTFPIPPSRFGLRPKRFSLQNLTFASLEWLFGKTTTAAVSNLTAGPEGQPPKFQRKGFSNPISCEEKEHRATRDRYCDGIQTRRQEIYRKRAYAPYRLCETDFRKGWGDQLDTVVRAANADIHSRNYFGFRNRPYNTDRVLIHRVGGLSKESLVQKS